MPVHRQKKETTAHTPGSTQQQPTSPLLDQQEFHQHLHALARGAVRVVIEEVIREELDQWEMAPPGWKLVMECLEIGQRT